VAHLNNAVEELTTIAKLHDEVDVSMVFKACHQLHDVWVVHSLGDLYLALE